jgi:hypothetical protein
VDRRVWTAFGAEDNNCFENTLPIHAVEYIDIETGVCLMCNHTENIIIHEFVFH